MKLKNLVLLTLLIVFGLASLIIFLTVPAERMDTNVFWLAFVFSVPVNFLASVGLTLWAFAKTPAEFVRPPAAFSITAIFSPALLIAGLIFVYANVVSVVWPIIVFATIMVAYFVLALYVTSTANYITSTEKQVQKKRLFIKLLEADVLDCAAKSTNPVTKAALTTLAESIRYSDPMSHASLAPIENDISALVYEMSAFLSSAPAADMTEKISRAQALLSSRNNRCLMLK